MQIARALTRWITMLSLGLWLGGIIFLGAVSAPAIFRFCRAHDVEALAPQLVGVIVARFAPLTMVLSALLVVAWLVDGFLTRRAAARETRLWRTQGAAMGAMIALALYLNTQVLPEMNARQAAVIRESASNNTPLSANAGGPKSENRARFDELHHRYSRFTMLVFWLGAGTLFLLAWRVSSDQNASVERKTLQVSEHG